MCRRPRGFFLVFKVGAHPHVTSLLEEVSRERRPDAGAGEIGVDPELDEFMVGVVYIYPYLSIYLII
jgi:hypothetical protein